MSSHIESVALAGSESLGHAALVRRMARGDEAATSAIVDANLEGLYRFVRRRTGSCAEDVEEIVQDTFVTAVQLGETFDGSCTTFTWLCCLARKRIADFLQYRGRQKRVPERMLMRIDDDSKSAFREIRDPSVSADEIVARMDRVRVVQALLDTLTPDQREAVTMRYIEGFSIPEIAQIMKRSERSVEALLERAKERPRREVLRWLGDSGFAAMCFDLVML